MLVAQRGSWSGIRGIRTRVGLVGLVLLAGLAVVFLRAVDLQVLKQDWLESLARDQHLRQIRLAPHRGEILDRNGGPLASSVEVESIFVDPKLLGSEEARREAVETLAPIVELSPAEKAELLARVLRPESRFAWVLRKAPPAVVAQVRELSLPGVAFVKEASRFYPQRELAAHVLGFVGADGHGLEGLERRYDQLLRGHAATVSALRDARGRALLAETSVPAAARSGARITLTLDRTIQFHTERVLRKAVRESGAKAGSAVVLDPRSGEVLAMAGFPTFNPNVGPRGKRAAVRNRTVTDTFEPGSTMKVFLLAGALEKGSIRPDQIFEGEGGRWRVGRHVVRDTRIRKQMNPMELLRDSSNIGAGKVGLAMGAEALAETYRAFGFGTRSEIGLPAEASGVVAEMPQEIAVVTAAFGQGPITATPLQLAAAFGAIANGGEWIQPSIVRSIVSPEGVTTAEPARRRVVSPATARTVTAWMEEVVGPKGTGRLAALEGYRVAGKTGTTQKVDPATGRYGAERIASFGGFVPADDPRLVIVVVLDEPAEGAGGGRVAAPAFREIAKSALRSLGVPSSAPREPTLVADAGGVDFEEEAAALHVLDDEEEAPPAPGSVRVPDLRGLGARSAVLRLGALGLEAKLDGSGVVQGQRPTAGSWLQRGGTVALQLDF